MSENRQKTFWKSDKGGQCVWCGKTGHIAMSMPYNGVCYACESCIPDDYGWDGEEFSEIDCTNIYFWFDEHDYSEAWAFAKSSEKKAAKHHAKLVEVSGGGQN